MKTLHIAFYTSVLGIYSVLHQPFSILFFITGKAVRFLVFFLFLRYVLQETSVAGYTTHQALLIFCTYTLVDTIAQILFRAVYLFRPLVLSGRFDGVLTKPHNPFARILLGSIDVLDLVMLVPYIILTVYLAYSASGADHMLWYIVFIGISLIITAAFHIGILGAALWTIDVDNTIMVYRDVTRLGGFPLGIYGKWLQIFLTYIIPVGLMMQVPVDVLFGKIQWFAVVPASVIAFALLGGSIIFWNKSLYRYQSWGG